MNFFDQQQQARRRSSLLVVLFLLSVIAIVVVIDLVVAMVVMLVTHDIYEPFPSFVIWLGEHPMVLLWSSLGSAGLIFGASLFRMISLGHGGGAVARMLGGTRIEPGTAEPLRRQLINVAEETAIAAGLPVPEVYVLETEPGINAFAAGYSTSDAAIAVTRGALESLTREELHGVVAHEFGHLINGDSRLNMRLLGLAFGILIVALAGRFILRGATHVRDSRDSRAMVFLLAAGFTLFVAGYLGVFAARLIKAAVSRNREYLADASAVQFTRNPAGLAGALKKIAYSPLRATIVSAQGEEISHMLIVEPAHLFSAVFASHPPIQERISRLDPAFRADDLKRIRLDPMVQVVPPTVVSPAVALPEILGLAAHRIVGLVGQPGDRVVTTAAAVESHMAPVLREAIRSPQDAYYLVIAMLLHRDPSTRDRQLERVTERLPDAPIGFIRNLGTQLDDLDEAYRLPLLELAFPAIRQRPLIALHTLVGLIDDLVRVDGKIRIFDYALSRLVRLQIAEVISPRRTVSTRTLKLHGLTDEIRNLFSLLATAGHEDIESARAAADAGMRHLLPSGNLHYAHPDSWTEAMDRSLLVLDRLPPLVKMELVDALGRTVLHDGQVTLAESELLRVVCAMLHCPLPPLANINQTAA